MSPAEAKEVKVPTEVMLVCAAVRRVPAMPPVTLKPPESTNKPPKMSADPVTTIEPVTLRPLFTDSPLSTPTDVMFVCVAVNKVPAIPPVTLNPLDWMNTGPAADKPPLVILILCEEVSPAVDKDTKEPTVVMLVWLGVTIVPAIPPVTLKPPELMFTPPANVAPVET